MLLLGTGLIGGCVKHKTAQSKLDTSKQTAINQQKANSDIGKMNERLYVEISARNIYEASKDPKTWITSGFSKFLTEQGVTAKQFSNFAQQLKNNKQNYQKVTKKIKERYQELKAN